MADFYQKKGDKPTAKQRIMHNDGVIIQYQKELDKFIQAAQAAGVVLTIETRPTENPLAMGEHVMYGVARKSRLVYQLELKAIQEEEDLDVQKRIMEELDSLQPPWSTGINKARNLAVGAQLCTRNGERTGNACLVAFDHDKYAVVITDIGTKMKLTRNEIHELFTVGRWYMNPSEYIRRVAP